MRDRRERRQQQAKKKAIDPVWLSLSVATLVFFSSFFFLFFVRGNADADRRRGAVIGLRRRWRFPFFFFKYFSPSRTFASSNNGQQKWRPFWLEKSVAAASTGDVVGDVAKCGPDFFFKIFFKTLLQHSQLRFHRISTTTTIPPKKKEEKFQAMTGRFPTTALFKSTEKKEQHLHPSNVHHRLHVPFFVVFHQFSSPTRRSWSATFFFFFVVVAVVVRKKKDAAHHRWDPYRQAEVVTHDDLIVHSRSSSRRSKICSKICRRHTHTHSRATKARRPKIATETRWKINKKNKNHSIAMEHNTVQSCRSQSTRRNRATLDVSDGENKHQPTAVQRTKKKTTTTKIWSRSTKKKWRDATNRTSRWDARLYGRFFFFLRVANGRHTTSEINFQSKRVSSFSSRSIIHKSPRSLEEIPKKNQSKNAERRHRSCRRFFQPSVIDRAAKEKQIVVTFFSWSKRIM